MGRPNSIRCPSRPAKSSADRLKAASLRSESAVTNVTWLSLNWASVAISNGAVRRASVIGRSCTWLSGFERRCFRRVGLVSFDNTVALSHFHSSLLRYFYLC